MIAYDFDSLFYGFDVYQYHWVYYNLCYNIIIYLGILKITIEVTTVNFSTAGECEKLSYALVIIIIIYI